MHITTVLQALPFLTIVLGLSLLEENRTFSLSTSDHIGPRVKTQNGTVEGFSLPAFNEDVFLGVPFAEPPVGDLRLRHPIPYQSAWTGVYNATFRGPSCPGYGPLDTNLTFGEDCLTLDIVRPSKINVTDNLPVYVWIYGGNFISGASADPRYNTSYIVNASIAMNKPIIAVSINYRVGGWGFLASREVAVANVSNIGLFDQRLALRWIQENIHHFGGDPAKVTIGGESCGAFSVGYHLTGFDGNNDGLFRAAIMESGNSIGPAVYTIPQLTNTYQPMFDNVTETVGCSNSSDSLDCLRKVPYKTLYDALSPFAMYPIVDDNFLFRTPSESFSKGLVADVAILTGTNTDEGTAFAPRRALNNNADIHEYVANINYGLDNTTVAKVMQLYPDNPAQGCPFGTGSERFASQGYMFKRGAAIIGDEIFHAGRRLTTQFYSSRPHWQRKPVYSYRFDQTPWNGIESIMAEVAPVYATHFSEICFVFNIEPSASVNNSNWIGPYPEFYKLSKLMSRSWISFIHELDPNHHGIENVPHWPDYSQSPSNFVFRVNDSTAELDDWRLEQLKYWAQIWGQLST